MDECRKILTAGVACLELVEDSLKIEKLLAFIELIIQWNKVYNLTAIRNRHDMARLHMLDSLAISPYLRGQRLCDIGTGAGLPGIPLAIYHPEKQFILVDSNAKKTRFVQQVILKLKLTNVSVYHSRVENFNVTARFDTVTCRAFANMNNIVDLTAHLLAKKGLLLAMKGSISAAELAPLVIPYQVITLHIPTIEVKRCLISIESSALT